MPPGQNELGFAPEYVAARAVLLDALEALSDHLSAIIVVGAQAVYLHTGSSDFVAPVMTTDADLAIDVTSLGSEPEIGTALATAEFKPGSNPGSWLGRGDVAVDIMVVPSQSGRTKKNARAARLAGHADNAARITPGLEPALVDHAARTLTALDPTDRRQVIVNVAGPAALLVAKAIKVQERLIDADAGRTARLTEKDALDILRLLQAVDVGDLQAGLRRHLDVDNARATTTRAVSFLKEHAMTPSSNLPALAAVAAGGDRTVGISFAALVGVLIDRFERAD